MDEVRPSDQLTSDLQDFIFRCRQMMPAHGSWPIVPPSDRLLDYASSTCDESWHGVVKLLVYSCHSLVNLECYALLYLAYVSES